MPETRAQRILRVLAGHPEGLSTPAIVRESGERVQPRQQALTRCGGDLRRLEARGMVERAGKVVEPGTYNNALSVRWRVTDAGRERLASSAAAEATADPGEGKSRAGVELGRRGGLRGGTACAESLPPQRRQEIAMKARARWGILPPSPSYSETLAWARQELEKSRRVITLEQRRVRALVKMTESLQYLVDNPLPDNFLTGRGGVLGHPHPEADRA